MAFLRSAMVAAGVPEALVYTKFASNDHLLVTPRQSSMIAEKLVAWLGGQNLTLDLAEADPGSRLAMERLMLLQKALGNRKEAARLMTRRRATNLPCRVDRKARKAIREFAAFCAGSGGFYVD